MTNFLCTSLYNHKASEQVLWGWSKKVKSLIESIESVIAGQAKQWMKTAIKK